MGMFETLFGDAGKGRSDQMRQQAIDAFNSIKTPELSDLQVQLSKYVQSGELTPEQAEAELLKSSAFNDIVSDPSLEGAQKSALSSLQNVANSGGLTAIDKAQLQDITNQQNQEARGRNESIMQTARERGMGNSDISTVNQLMNEQGAADRASQRGTDVAAQAQARALQSMIAAGNTAGGIRGQDYAEQAEKAKAENAIDLFNKQTLNQTNLYNVDTANRAQAANLAAKQATSDANTQTENQNKMYNAQQNQQLYDDQLKKASGISGQYSAAAGDALKSGAQDTAAKMGLASGAAQAIGAMVGGMAGQQGAKEATKSEKYDYNKGGMVEGCGYCEGGMCMKHGGQVPGEAKVAGDSPKNDTVPAKLSPGEVVVPRSALSDDAEFDKFMEQFRPSKKHEKIDESIPMHTRVLADLHKRISKVEGR